VPLRSKPSLGERARLGLADAIWAGLGWLAASMVSIDRVTGLGGEWVLPGMMLMGFLLGGMGLGRVVRIAATVALATVLAVLWIPALSRLSLAYVRNDPIPSAPVDAIMVLSASVTTDGHLSVDGADRLLGGLDLYRRGVAPRLIVSRVTNATNHEPSDLGQQRLYQATGLQPEVYVVDSVGTTRLEAVRAWDLARAKGWRRIVVITSPIHTRRACATFAKVGFDVVCRMSPDRSVSIWSLLDGEERLRAFGAWLYEALGWREYRWRDWV
jgi:uncharacterized SAM-binding protein YcdF (DUF218 family)